MLPISVFNKVVFVTDRTCDIITNFKCSKMGNDIKLPISQRREEQQIQSTEENKTKCQLNYEIERISDEIRIINQKIDRLELNLKQIRHNVQYYKVLIMDMSTKLHQIKQDQVNIGLTDENYVEKAKRYLDSLDEFCCEAETDEMNAEGYSHADISVLEDRVISLNQEVSTNDKIIAKRIEKLSTN
jgi:chromosome segregation ATPase